MIRWNITYLTIDRLGIHLQVKTWIDPYIITDIIYAYNQHNKNINTMDITTIKSIHKLVHLHTEYHRNELFITECENQPEMGLPRSTRP